MLAYHTVLSWVQLDRIIDIDSEDAGQVLVKWAGLPYAESTYEHLTDLEASSIDYTAGNHSEPQPLLDLLAAALKLILCIIHYWNSNDSLFTGGESSYALSINNYIYNITTQARMSVSHHL